jgi:hypothetical protein
MKADGSGRVVRTVTAATDTTVTLSSAPTGIVAGDMLHLAPLTPATNNLDPFTSAQTIYRFGDDAVAALAATHMPVENGSTWTLKHAFEDPEGAKSSGNFDLHLGATRRLDRDTR